MKVILIVDDEKEICLLLSAILRGMGYSTLQANTLKEAIDLAKEKNPDLMFLDIHLPDGSGLEQVPQFQSINKNLPIVMMSAFDTPEMRQQAEILGVHEFLSKPFTLTQVSSVVTSLFTH